MKVTSVDMHIEHDGKRFIVTKDSVARFSASAMDYYKEFSPHLSLPYTQDDAERAIAQAEKEPGDEFVRSTE